MSISYVGLSPPTYQECLSKDAWKHTSNVHLDPPRVDQTCGGESTTTVPDQKDAKAKRHDCLSFPELEKATALAHPPHVQCSAAPLPSLSLSLSVFLDYYSDTHNTSDG